VSGCSRGGRNTGGGRYPSLEKKVRWLQGKQKKSNNQLRQTPKKTTGRKGRSLPHRDKKKFKGEGKEKKAHESKQKRSFNLLKRQKGGLGGWGREERNSVPKTRSFHKEGVQDHRIRPRLHANSQPSGLSFQLKKKKKKLKHEIPRSDP